MKNIIEFLKLYEISTNSHDFENLKEYIDNEAVYIFSDGIHRGIDEIEKAFIKTWGKIKNEVYKIEAVQELIQTENIKVLQYDFSWFGDIDGVRCSGKGIGTTSILKKNGKWKIQHEHLSMIS